MKKLLPFLLLCSLLAACTDSTQPTSDSSGTQTYTDQTPNEYIKLQADLNGDGTLENISLDVKKAEDPRDMSLTAILTIGDTSVTVPGGNPEGYFGLVDLDIMDDMKEIAISDDGPSSDLTTNFYTYDGTKIISMGQVEGAYEGMDFNEHGTFTTQTRGKILDTWFYRDDYSLGADHILTHDAKNFYARMLSSSEPIVMLKDLPLQTSPTDSTIIGTAKKGQTVSILGCDDVKWCELDSEGILGWFEVDSYDKMPISGSEDLTADDYFQGLNRAD